MGVTPSDQTTRGFAEEPVSGLDRRHLLVFSSASPWMYPLPVSGEVVIGRSETADLRIDDALVSRHHARLVFDGGPITITDLGSQRGTYVNGVRVTGPRVLHPNDRIALHRTTLIFYDAGPLLAAPVDLDMTGLRPRVPHEPHGLLAGARGTNPGSPAVPDVERAFQVLAIGAQRVIVADPTVRRLYTLVERLAPSAIPVLITGETGCGKELVATALHVRSSRASQRLISLNCAALHEMLVESELFGHERGAFSGAVSSRPGLIEAASGSTLFLDEVGELTLANQAKLLRVLESHRVTRLGDVREREVDVRIVAATNRDLEADMVAGRFRRDLYFRLSAATLSLPPLRQRPHELPLLAAAFLDDACRLTGRRGMRIADDAMAALLAHPWPGNVRELKNLMQYVAATLPVDELLAEHVSERLGRLSPRLALPPDGGPATPAQFRPLADELRELETARIREALIATGGNQTRAAGLLAMPVRTFFEKAKHYGLTPKKKRYDD
jgi:DNA-binding NtrC family response regulator